LNQAVGKMARFFEALSSVDAFGGAAFVFRAKRAERIKLVRERPRAGAQVAGGRHVR